MESIRISLNILWSCSLTYPYPPGFSFWVCFAPWLSRRTNFSGGEVGHPPSPVGENRKLLFKLFSRCWSRSERSFFALCSQFALRRSTSSPLLLPRLFSTSPSLVSFRVFQAITFPLASNHTTAKLEASKSRFNVPIDGNYTKIQTTIF